MMVDSGRPKAEGKRKVNMYLREDIIKKADEVAHSLCEPRSRTVERAIELLYEQQQPWLNGRE